MFSRWGAIYGACLSLSLVGVSTAGDIPPGQQRASSQDWAGHIIQLTTRNGSTLSEYRAQTNSVNAPDTFMVVSMLPRFSCEPTVSIVVANTVFGNDPEAVALTMVIDEVASDYPPLVDKSESYSQLTMNGNQESHQQLRAVIDDASWAQFEWRINSPALSNADAGSKVAASDGTFDFSLLGSRKTIKEMEELCLNHTPIPYSN